MNKMSVAVDEPSSEITQSGCFVPSKRGDWTWELATFFPRQGEWTEGDYLSLATARLIEFSDGVLEFLPRPRMSHVRVSKYLSECFNRYVSSRRIGEVFWAPCPIRVGLRKFREPDSLFLNTERIPKDDTPPNGADLVVEVVSEGKTHRQRDLETKRQEYAEAGIPEYWIVDPKFETISVLTLLDGVYQSQGEFGMGTRASSVGLPGFEVDVSSVFASAKPLS